MKTRVLTGITTSGTPHLGNYAGAIRPSIQASLRPDTESYYFLADYHALVKCDDPRRVARSRLEIAATWLAAGLDPEQVVFYRQSDIPEIPQLCWMLTCVTAKGLMNRAHAYKAAVDANEEKQLDLDDGVTMGLFSYPILMSADILMFNAHQVPVGRDQIQHLEMARDIAQRFNNLYGDGEELFVLPDVFIDENVATLPGLDGRKMSKSYDNTIPLFEGGEHTLKNAINRIVTDSSLPGEPKDPDASHLYSLFQAFASAEQAQAFRQELLAGLAWGDAKNQLFELIAAELAPMRERYKTLMAAPEQVEEILQEGARKARSYAGPFIEKLRHAVGLRQASAVVVAADTEAAEAPKPKASHRFVSFRDDDGTFRFRLYDANDEELFLSEPFMDPKRAGYVMRSLQQGLLDEWVVEDDDTATIVFEEIVVCRLPREQIAAVQQCLQPVEE